MSCKTCRELVCECPPRNPYSTKESRAMAEALREVRDYFPGGFGPEFLPKVAAALAFIEGPASDTALLWIVEYGAIDLPMGDPSRLEVMDKVIEQQKAVIDGMPVVPSVNPACGVHGPFPCEGARCICTPGVRASGQTQQEKP